MIGERHARRLPSRLEAQADVLLDALNEAGVTATFFVLGQIIDTHASLLRRIFDAGHELGARNRHPEPLAAIEPSTFIGQANETRDRLQQLTGRAVGGFRIARGRFGPNDNWALDALADAGFAYDSSVYPRGRELRRSVSGRFPYKHTAPSGAALLELPLSAWGPDGWLLPLAGGTTARQLPGRSLERLVSDWTQRYTSPFMLYFHLWEFDPQVPRLGVADRWTRLRRYRNLQRTPETLRGLLATHRFEAVQDFMRTAGAVEPAVVGSAVLQTTAHSTDRHSAPIESGVLLNEASKAHCEPFTAVIPCFNEEDALPYAAATLDEVRLALSPREVQFLFVDDASTDRTAELLHRDFAPRPDCRVVRHETNRGVAAAILTGIEHADTSLVGSMDCDCTYDPTGFAELLAHLPGEAAMITASPYHPKGRVMNVPGWRLALSRSLSWMYRRLLRTGLYTYTSCFRVYRRDAMLGLPLQYGGFLGMAEMVVRLEERGAIIAEHPATLESRLLGSSKMKTLRTIRGHLGLLGRVAARRCWAKVVWNQAKPGRHDPSGLKPMVKVKTPRREPTGSTL